MVGWFLFPPPTQDYDRTHAARLVGALSSMPSRRKRSKSESSESESEPAARDVPLARDTTAATAAAATEQQPLRSWTADDPAVGQLIEQVGAYPATGGVYPYIMK